MSPGRLTLVDTSVAVALVVEDHEFHRDTVAAVGNRDVGLSGHAWFETYSVLTRLPPPTRRAPPEVAAILEHDFAASRFLSADRAAALASRLASIGVAGGSVYDALVAAAAAEHGAVLLTRDRRAVDMYRAVDAEIEWVG